MGARSGERRTGAGVSAPGASTQAAARFPKATDTFARPLTGLPPAPGSSPFARVLHAANCPSCEISEDTVLQLDVMSKYSTSRERTDPQQELGNAGGPRARAFLACT